MAHDWQTRLTRFLITGGLAGREQSRIMTFMADHVYADRVLHELNVLRAEGKVQKFNVPVKGKGVAAIWRATTEIITPRSNGGDDALLDASDDDLRE